MAKGICKLCLQEKDLQKSHFIGAGLYRSANRRGGAVIKTPKLFIGIDKQIQDHVLCRDCEQLFCKEGEDYVTPLVKQAEGNSPLLERLIAEKPISSGPNHGDVLSATKAGIDIEKIAYYGLSMFWRSAVHEWPTKVQGQNTTKSQMSFEELEAIRKYLRKETGWPPGIVLQITVCDD